MRYFIISLFLVLALFSCKSKIQESPEVVIDNTDTPEVTQSPKASDFAKSLRIKETVTYLASDELQGRDTGSEGIEKAAVFLEKKLKDFGVNPYFETYRDNFMARDKNAYNIVGMIEGNDPKLKEEFVIIGAHYDHIGTAKASGDDTIANGANDNAAGTTAILELANYFSTNNTNKRSILFTFFSAEEMGLLGSKHLASKLKDKNLNLYVMLNFEMVGVPFIGRDYEAFLTGYDLSNMAQKMNDYSGSNLIGFSEVAKQYNLFKASDNYAFYQEFNLPSQTISSCDLSNYSEYHKVGDESTLLNYDFMANLVNKMIPVIEQITQTPTKEIKMNE